MSIGPRLTTSILLVAAALAACGDDGSSPSSASSGEGGAGAGHPSGVGAAGPGSGAGGPGSGAGGPGSGAGGPGSGGGGEGAGLPTSTCAKLQPLQNFESEPSAVAMLFTAEDCETGIPITGLEGDDFLVQENGEALSSEAHRDVLGGRGYRVVTELLLDFSDSTLPIRAQLIDGAKAFVEEILVTRGLDDRVKIGVTVFDGRAEVERLQLPISDAAALGEVLDGLSSYVPGDGASTNLNGALRQGVEELQTRLRSIAERNLGGVVATGHVVLFTDGADTAGREEPGPAQEAVEEARDVQVAGPSGVAQTWAVALVGEDYDPAALESLLGDDRWIFEAPDAAELEQTFDAMGDRISAQVEATYLFAYCSAKRMGSHTVSIDLKQTVIPESQGLSFSFSADTFEGGCNAEFFETACDNKQCGGFACGACDDGLVCQVASLTCGESDGYAEVHPGSGHTCASRIDGSIACWGQNTAGQLGLEGGQSLPNPEPVPNVAQIATLAASSRTFAVRSDGAVLTWGSWGEDDAGSATPTLVDGISDALQVDVHSQHACAVLGDGSVECWGANDAGQLGFESGPEFSFWPSPVPVDGVSNAIQVAVGFRHSCALMSDGAVMCWGDNDFGQIGNGITTNSPTPPSFVQSVDGATQIASGAYHSCALLSDGTARCWGMAGNGQLGHMTEPPSLEPTPVPVDIEGVVQISAGGSTSCAVLADRTVQCWGANQFGQVGDGTIQSKSLPASVSSIAGALRVETGGQHTCAVIMDGSARCWGRNFAGQLGDGSTSPLVMVAVVVGTP